MDVQRIQELIFKVSRTTLTGALQKVFPEIWNVFIVSNEKQEIANAPFGFQNERLIHFVAEQGTKEMLEEVVKYSNINEVDNLGATPLYIAISAHNTPNAMLLIEKGCQLTGLKLLPIVAACYSTGLIKRLLDAGADINEKDCKGNCALSESLRLLHLSSVEFLLELGADPNVYMEFNNPIICYTISILSDYVYSSRITDTILRLVEKMIPKVTNINGQMQDLVDKKVLSHNPGYGFSDWSHGQSSLRKAIESRHEKISELVMGAGCLVHYTDLKLSIEYSMTNTSLLIIDKMHNYGIKDENTVYVNEGFRIHQELIPLAWYYDYAIYKYLLKLRGAFYKNYSPTLFEIVHTQLSINHFI